MADISLVNSIIGSGRGQLGIGPLMIAASLEEAGFSVEFKDYQNEDVKRKADPQVLAQYMKTSAPVLGISVICNALPSVLQAVDLLKEEHDITVIIGGPSASMNTERILELSQVDVAVIGEGERTIVDIMNTIEEGGSLCDVAGICYRENGRVIKTPQQERIKDLDSLPLPAYHHIDFNEYNREVNIITARGCPFHCTFCAKAIWRNLKTYRSIENVIEELLLIQDQIERINLVDDTFILEKDRVYEFCTALRKESVDKPWSCTGRINLMPDSLIETMRDGGCDTVFFGIESGSPAVLKEIKKDFTPEEARNDIMRAKQYFKKVYTSYMWGFPFESLEDFYDTLMFQMEDVRLGGIHPVMTLLTPFPSTTLYSEYKDKIRFTVDNTYNGSTLPPPERLQGYPQLMEFVTHNPDVFSSFYYYENEGFEEKCKIVDKIREEMQTQGEGLP